MANRRIEEFRNHIGGEWTASVGGKTFDNVNPADTRDIVGRFQASTSADALAAVDAAAAAFAGWRATPISKRAKVLLDAADHLEANAAAFALELTREEGKPLSLAKDEFLRSAQTLRFYAIEGQTFAGETFPNDDPDMLVYTQREPLGVVTVISPWNFPVSIPGAQDRAGADHRQHGGLQAVVGCAAERLSPGRGARPQRPAQGRAQLHHRQRGPRSARSSPNRRRCARSRSPARPDAGKHIHDSVPLTTRTQMELGGKNPLIVMEDADLDQAVDLAIKGGLSLSGQACTGTSRILVVKQVRDAFIDKLVARVKALKIGSGTTAGMDVGPAGDRQAARDRAVVRRHRQAGGHAPVRRRPPERRGLRPRLLRVAGGLHRRRPVDADRAGGDLRSGAGGDRRGRATRTRSPRPTTRRTGCRRRSPPAIRATCTPSPTTSSRAR